MRVLIVEDEMLISMMLEDFLVEMGYAVVGVAARLPQAIEMASALDFDVAILDVNLDGRHSFPVAEVLSKRNIPFLFATGYGVQGIDDPFKCHVTIGKPFQRDRLRQALESLSL